MNGVDLYPKEVSPLMLAVIQVRFYEAPPNSGPGTMRAVAAWQVGPYVSTRTIVPSNWGRYRGSEETSPKHLAASLDAFEYLVEIAAEMGESLTLYISDNRLRRKLMSVLGSFPTVTVVDVARGSLLQLSNIASDSLDADTRAREIPPPPDRRRPKIKRLNRKELTIATDASKGRRKGVGIACISESGKWYQAIGTTATSVLEGELLAIELAIDNFRGHPLHILTDSQDALQRLGALQVAAPGALRTTPRQMKVIERILAVKEERKIRFSWVRGHQGHMLNETANRLAIAARRAYESNIPRETQLSIAIEIVKSERSIAEQRQLESS